jgi:SAM-dependent methyltransferase
MNYKNNKYILRLKRLLYYIYGEKFYKELNYDWSEYPTRSNIINRLIDQKSYTSFLEIGCDQNSNFSNVNISKKVGVDPNSGGTHKMTSDKFFEINSDKFDLIFIDGLHVTSQVDRDIENSLKCLKEGGIILLHDCLPKKIWHQIVPCVYPKWNGDVWKSIVKSRTRPDINTYTIIADHGIGVIFKEKNKDILDLNLSKIKKLKYEDYYKNHSKFMNLISVEKFFELAKMHKLN